MGIEIFLIYYLLYTEPRPLQHRDPILDHGVDERPRIPSTPDRHGGDIAGRHGRSAGVAQASQGAHVEPRGAAEHLLGYKVGNAAVT